MAKKLKQKDEPTKQKEELSELNIKTVRTSARDAFSDAVESKNTVLRSKFLEAVNEVVIRKEHKETCFMEKESTKNLVKLTILDDTADGTIKAREEVRTQAKDVLIKFIGNYASATKSKSHKLDDTYNSAVDGIFEELKNIVDCNTEGEKKYKRELELRVSSLINCIVKNCPDMEGRAKPIKASNALAGDIDKINGITND